MPDKKQENTSYDVKRTTLDDAARALLLGKPVVFPTDTVYGIGIAVTTAEDCSQLSEIKQRPGRKPIAWLVGGIEDIDLYGADVPEWAYELARAYWPGASCPRKQLCAERFPIGGWNHRFAHACKRYRLSVDRRLRLPLGNNERQRFRKRRTGRLRRTRRRDTELC